jgi:hypothetical protein
VVAKNWTKSIWYVSTIAVTFTCMWTYKLRSCVYNWIWILFLSLILLIFASRFSSWYIVYHFFSRTDCVFIFLWIFCTSYVWSWIC